MKLSNLISDVAIFAKTLDSLTVYFTVEHGLQLHMCSPSNVYYITYDLPCDNIHLPGVDHFQFILSVSEWQNILQYYNNLNGNCNIQLRLEQIETNFYLALTCVPSMTWTARVELSMVAPENRTNITVERIRNFNSVFGPIGQFLNCLEYGIRHPDAEYVSVYYDKSDLCFDFATNDGIRVCMLRHALEFFGESCKFTNNFSGISTHVWVDAKLLKSLLEDAKFHEICELRWAADRPFELHCECSQYIVYIAPVLIPDPEEGQESFVDESDNRQLPPPPVLINE